MAAARTPGQRAGLTRAGVVAAARDLLASEGPDALTMRGLAQRLGVHPNALYSHVRSKPALIDDVLDDVLGEVAAPAADAVEPAAGLQAIMASTLQVLLAHPGLVPLYVARQGARGANARRLGEIMLRLLDRAGVGGEAAREAQRVLIVYTIGFAAFGTRLPLEPERTVPSEEIVTSFERGLAWLLAGIVTRPG